MHIKHAGKYQNKMKKHKLLMCINVCVYVYVCVCILMEIKNFTENTKNIENCES